MQRGGLERDDLAIERPTGEGALSHVREGFELRLEKANGSVVMWMLIHDRSHNRPGWPSA